MGRFNTNLRQITSAVTLSTAALFAAPTAVAQELPKGTFATVNGQPLSESLLDINVQANIARGQADTPQLREVIEQEIIGREVLAQEAQKLKLEQTPQAQAQWQQMQQNFLANLLLQNYADKNPVTEKQIKVEYDEFLQELKGAKQYKLSLIVVPTQERAKEIIAQLRSSKDKGLFNKLAQQESIDASKADEGKLDWLLPQQMLPAVGNVVVNLSAGTVTAAPIQTRSGWNVVRVDEIRDYSPPAMADIENQLRQAAAQKQLATHIRSLQEKAKIVQ
jgi:peptidyl-prolyl cis-trans isomerase C